MGNVGKKKMHLCPDGTLTSHDWRILFGLCYATAGFKDKFIITEARVAQSEGGLTNSYLTETHQQ